MTENDNRCTQEMQSRNDVFSNLKINDIIFPSIIIVIIIVIVIVLKLRKHRKNGLISRDNSTEMENKKELDTIQTLDNSVSEVDTSTLTNAEPSEEDYSLMILKNRLAKGDITIDEFNALKEVLTKTSNSTDKYEINEVNKKIEKLETERMKTQIIQNRGKNESIAIILALLLGFVGLQGIGHIYAGKSGKGVGILIASIVMFVSGISMAFIQGSLLSFVGALILVVYFIMFIWQIFDARKSCQLYNQNLV
jgi:uncharacterized membrane protein